MILQSAKLKYKNIVLYSKNLPPEKVGGIETNAFYLIKRLLNVSGVRLHVVTLTGKKLFLFRSKRISLGSHRVKVNLLEKKLKHDSSAFVQLLRRLRCKPEDTLIYHNTLDLHRLYADIRANGFGQVARSGGNDLFFVNSDEVTGSAIQNCNALNRLFVNSEYSYRRAVEAGLNEQIVRIIKGGCSRELDSSAKADIQSSAPIILSCCRVVDFKGLEDAIDACHLLDKQGLEFTYLIIGDGNLREQIGGRIAQYQLQAKCFLMGKMPLEQVHAYYQAADIYLSTSKDVVKISGDKSYVHTETMGRSLCEAQIHGLPVVTTDAGGSPEMVQHGLTGLIVKQGDAESIANALASLIKNNDRREEMGRQAAVHAEKNLSWDAVIQKLLNEMAALD